MGAHLALGYQILFFFFAYQPWKLGQRYYQRSSSQDLVPRTLGLTGVNPTRSADEEAGLALNISPGGISGTGILGYWNITLHNA
jgi:hypothetical protein